MRRYDKDGNQVIEEIPAWCKMPEDVDCYGIALGKVRRQGIRYCEGCEFKEVKPCSQP